MKRIFIPAKSKLDLSNLEKKLKEYVKNIKGTAGIVTTTQYSNQAKKLKIPKAIYIGTILGCTKNIDRASIKYFIFLGNGKFHPINIAKKTNKKVIIVDTIKNNITEIKKSEIDKYNLQLRAKYKLFLNADKIGILVSTKEGQNRIKEAIKLKKQIKKPAFIFLTNTLPENELENFPDINFWINTACPRIENNKIINLEDLKEFL